MKSITFGAPMVQALLDGRDTRKRIYPKKDESPMDAIQLAKRIINGISINLSTDCWEWRKSHNGLGYGTLTVEGKRKYAHRLSYELFIGDIPEGMFVLHECDNPSCINPEHLHLGTQSKNMKECYTRGRSSIKPVSLAGEKNGASKLTKPNVEAIRMRAADGERQQSIATSFGISQAQVSNIVRGVNWR